jgi:hypothetical protein
MAGARVGAQRGRAARLPGSSQPCFFASLVRRPYSFVQTIEAVPFRRTHQLQSLGNDVNDVFSLKFRQHPRNGFDSESQEIRNILAGLRQCHQIR